MTALLIAIVALSALTVLKADDARTIQLLAPLNGATVRESIPVRLSPADLPSDGYVTVSVDKVFRTAKLVDPKNSLIYTWDSQAPFQDSNNPGVQKYTDDGSHEIEVAIYDRQGTLLASGASTINLANKVTNLPDGITLSYNWSEDETLRYKRHSEINSLSTSDNTPAQTAQSADIKFSRSVEDISGAEYLVRDLIYNDGTITTNGQATPVQAYYLLKSRYRTVNKYGDLLVEETPFSTGDHFGFPIPQVPGRRISEGDSWDAKVEVSVPWANAKPTVLDGTARLDSFEWQDGYPTAKVIETFDGPAKFYADARATVRFQADNVHLVRTYWFAYNSKRLVRVRTDMTIDGNVGSDVTAALGLSSGMGGPGAMGPGGMGPGGMGPGGMGPGGMGPGGMQPGAPGGYGYGSGPGGSGGQFSGRQDESFMNNPLSPGKPANLGSPITFDESGNQYGGYNGGYNGGQQGGPQMGPQMGPYGPGGAAGPYGPGAGGVATTSPIKLEIIDDTSLIGV